jgi:hypothetical protein
MTATTIGMRRSLVDVLAGWPLPEGDGATDAATDGDGVAATERPARLGARRRRWASARVHR